MSRVADGAAMRRGLLLVAVMAASSLCAAQKYAPPPPPLTVDPCAAVANPLLPKDPATKAQPVCPPPAAVRTPTPAGTGTTAADQFPFPGEAVPTAKPSVSEQFPYPGSTPAPAPVPGTGKAADQFPYPGETGKSLDAVPEGNTPRYVPDAPAPGRKPPPESDPDAGSSSSSSSSSSGGDSASAPADEPSADGTGARSHGRRALPKVSAVTPEDRVSEDLDVAKFYSDRGNFQAAYLRAKDATRLMPDDAETHFALAQAAEKLKRKGEAAAEYTLYLKLDPSGEKKRAAETALSQLR